MDVLYTCDNNYIWLMGISVISMFENNSDFEDLNVYLLGENVSNENKIILKQIEKKYNRKITIIDVPKLDIPQALVSDRWPLSAFTRLYSGELLPDDVHRILYLDCDTIVTGSLENLERCNISGKIFWGVKDCIGKEYKKNIGIGEDGVYINAGVLLINLDELRKIQIKKLLDQYMQNYKKIINYADQDVLNGVFLGKIGILPPCYDVMTIAYVYSYKEIQILRSPTNFYHEEELEFAIKNPVIIHYTTNMLTIRPWYSNSDHPMTKEFRKYLSISPWKNRELEEMNFGSKEATVISIVNKLPRWCSMRILGFIHSTLKPIIIRIKSK